MLKVCCLATLVAVWAQQTPEQTYSEARKLVAAGEARSALALFRELIEQQPSFSRSYLQACMAYHRLGTPDEAMAHFEDLRTRHPGSAYPLYGLGIYYEVAQDY